MPMRKGCHLLTEKMNPDARKYLIPPSMLTDYDFMKMALEEARLAGGKDEVPVGAVLVNEGVVLAKGHNSPITTRDPSAHAEMIVLRKASEIIRNYRLPQAELYVTLEPCIMCAGAILQARIKRVVFGARDPKAGAVVSLYELLSDNRLNHQTTVTEGILSGECGEILSRFFQKKRITSAAAAATVE